MDGRGNRDWLAAVAVAAMVALIVGVVRACGGGDDPVASISSAANEAAADLNDAAVDVDDAGLDDLSDFVTDAARRLSRVAAPDYGDLEDLAEASTATAAVQFVVSGYLERAVTVAERASSEERAEAALRAARRAASFLTDSFAHFADLNRMALNLEFEEDARRYDDDDADGYFKAIEAFLEAGRKGANANAEYHIARAELAVASFRGDSARSRARDALEDAQDDLDDAERELERTSDDVDYFHGLINWRDRPSLFGAPPTPTTTWTPTTTAYQ